MTKELQIEGMMCEHCQARVQKALNDLAGVEATVSLEDKKAVCTVDASIQDDDLKKAVVDAGYEVVNIA